MQPRILVVDDDQAIVELIHDLLIDEGYEVLTLSALPPDPAAMTRSRPDLLILDDQIGAEPVGWRTTRQLRAAPATAQLPIILCTAATLAPERLADFQRLHVTVLPKPFAIDDLLAGIAQLLNRLPA